MTSSARKVSKADIQRGLDLIRALGLKPGAIEILPGKVRILAEDFKALTLPDDEAELDAELAEHMKKRGYG
ncbi:MAG: hypothetical protein J0H10_17125 [Alphaproteobacteria bacterium]|nr:hypothetical protein [Alphaproteobacteria bacterium]